MIVSEDLDMAYLAGFFDGEGHVGIYERSDKQNGGSFRLEVGVTQCDPRPLYRFQEYFGGAVRLARPQKGTVKDLHVWRLSTLDEKEKFLSAMDQWCRVKSSQVGLALEFIGVLRSKDRKSRSLEPCEVRIRRKYADEIKRLKRVVWRKPG